MRIYIHVYMVGPNTFLQNHNRVPKIPLLLSKGSKLLNFYMPLCCKIMAHIMLWLSIKICKIRILPLIIYFNGQFEEIGILEILLRPQPLSVGNFRVRRLTDIRERK